MRTLTQLEPLAIALVVGVVTLTRRRLPVKVELGEAILVAAAILLVQGLARDLMRLREARALAAANPTRITCVCAESSLGAGAIVVGLLLVFALSPRVMHVPAYAWPIATAVVLLLGFGMKHLVFDWSTRRLRLLSAHDGVVVWKK